MRRAAFFVLLLAGCATAPPDAARIEVHAENGEARIIRVDGRTVLAAAALPVAPGRHRLGVYCRYNLSIMIGDAHSVEREIEADLGAGGRYRIEAAMTPVPCTVTLTRVNP
jgi:hypothetical protein